MNERVESLCCKGSCPTIAFRGNDITITDDYDNVMSMSRAIAYALAVKILINDYNIRNNMPSYMQEMQEIEPSIIIMPAIKPENLDITISVAKIIVHRDEAYKMALSIIANEYRENHNGEYALSDNKNTIKVVDDTDN